jgi:hypothetical protein
MFTGAAQRAGLTRLKPGAVIFQIFNRFFPLAERFQVEIVLVFVFVLRPALRQGSVEFCLLRLRLLYAFGVLAQTLAQQLMLFMQGEQPLAQRSRLGLLRYRRRNVIGAQRQGAGGSAVSFWRSAARRLVWAVSCCLSRVSCENCARQPAISWPHKRNRSWAASHCARSVSSA